MGEPRLEGKGWGKDLEMQIAEHWKASKAYRFDPNSGKPVYSIDTPPPYVNTPVHAGHATTYTIMDMIARFKRMTGHSVLFPLGLDRNGLPIEVAAEKKFKVNMSETSRTEFVGMCKKVLEESSAESVDSFFRLGHSYSSWEAGEKIGDLYYTDSESYRTLTQNTFIDLWHKGMIREEKRTNNYCPHCRTTIADCEIQYKDFDTTFHYIRFMIKGAKAKAGEGKEGEDYVVVATTRPEMLAACAMVLFNPEDSRYKRLEGKTLIVPVYGFGVTLKAHPIAKIDAGSGLVMMCSFGDYTDIRFFREEGLKEKVVIGTDGRLNSNSGFLEGLSVKEGRQKIVDEMKSQGLVSKEEKIMHRTPICERSKTPIEFIPMTEYYLDQMKWKEKVRKDQKKIKFFSEKSRQILLDWIDTVSMDWPVSRRRYYATEIPLWYCRKCGATYVPPKGKYYKPWKDSPPVKACEKCGHTEFRGEERVFDTWFDSSISPLYILGYQRNQEFFDKNFPCSIRPQGKEIVRTWLYYTLLRGQQLTGKNAFRDVWVHYHVLDANGIKMSKSLGNGIDPHQVLDKFGAEPFRMWCALEGNIHQTDLRCSFDRIDGAAKFLTKLWNVSRFISMFPEPKSRAGEGKGRKAELCALDDWILDELDGLVKYSKSRYEKYDFHNPAVKIKNFVTETFASHYLELAKNRAYNQEGKFSEEEQDEALRTLNHCLETVLRLLAPIVPFITCKVYKDLWKKDVHSLDFPEAEKTVKKEAGKSAKAKPKFSSKDVISADSAIWKAKKDAGKSLKDELSSAVLPEKLKAIEKDFVSAHRIKAFSYGKRMKVTV